MDIFLNYVYLITYLSVLFYMQYVLFSFTYPQGTEYLIVDPFFNQVAARISQVE